MAKSNSAMPKLMTDRLMRFEASETNSAASHRTTATNTVHCTNSNPVHHNTACQSKKASSTSNRNAKSIATSAAIKPSSRGSMTTNAETARYAAKETMPRNTRNDRKRTANNAQAASRNAQPT